MNVSCSLGSHCAAVGRHIVGGFGPGFLLLVVLAVAAVGYSATRLGHRRREGRIEDSTWRPERQGPSSTGAVASSEDQAGPPPASPAPLSAVGPPAAQLPREGLATRSPELAASEERAQQVNLAEPAPLRQAPPAAPPRALSLRFTPAVGWRRYHQWPLKERSTVRTKA